MATLHLYLDESGDLNFSRAGTKYYVFAAAWTYNPKPIVDSLTRLRFNCLKEGYDIQGFHASEDKQHHRNLVVSSLLSYRGWKYAAVIVEKTKVNPAIREPHVFYPKFCSIPLKFIFRGRITSDTSMCMIFTDRIPVAKYKNSVEKTIKLCCRAEIPKEIPFHLYHHPRISNNWLQVTDYCCWAVYRKWERGDSRTYDQLRPQLAAPELDVLGRGKKEYY